MDVALGLSAEELEKRGAWWTAREIGQQPAVWRETADMVQSRRKEAEAFLGPLFKRQGLRVVLTGAGTSAFAGELLAPALSRRLGARVEAIATTDIVSNPYECLAEDLPTLLVSFARSGNSPESVAATELAEACLSECHHLVLTCDPEGRLYRDHSGAERSLALLMPKASNDQGFAMTSSFTSMVLAAWLVLGGTQTQDPGGLVERLAAAAERALSNQTGGIRNLAASVPEGYGRVVYLGSGPLKGLARESALKLLELTAGAVATFSDSPMGFRHGPKSLLDEHTLIVVYISNDPHTRQYDLDLFAELQRSVKRPDSLVALTTSAAPGPTGARSGEERIWAFDGLEEVEDPMLALPFVLVAQLIGLYYSLDLDLTPDNPFPDEEVNRVVQGVAIHPLQTDRQAGAAGSVEEVRG